MKKKIKVVFMLMCLIVSLLGNGQTVKASEYDSIELKNSCTDSGKQLFSEYLTGIVRTGDIVLCRIRYLVFPSVYQI